MLYWRSKSRYYNPEVGDKTIKPYYNILLDDRAGLEESYLILKETIKRFT